jgi:hypothetical protein
MYDDQDANSVPLTAAQKGRLLFECVPLVVFIAIAIFYGTALRDLVANLTVLFWSFFAALFLGLGYQTLKRLRDLFSGTALLERDRLENSHRTSGSASSGALNRPFYGEFARLGKMRLVGKAGDEAQAGQTYRVLYSPVSRIVWELESVD